jgi:hypothetical protein
MARIRHPRPSSTHAGLAALRQSASRFQPCSRLSLHSYTVQPREVLLTVKLSLASCRPSPSIRVHLIFLFFLLVPKGQVVLTRSKDLPGGREHTPHTRARRSCVFRPTLDTIHIFREAPRPASRSTMSEPPLELPFEAQLLVPFIVTARQRRGGGDRRVRFQL